MWVGVGGYATAGKDAFADFLVGEGFTKTYMSEPLERILLLLDPIVYTERDRVVRYAELHQQVGYERSKQVAEVRRLLQVLGTEVGRDMIGADVWVDIMAKSIAHEKNAVITGIRFPNELAAIRRHGGELVWIDRPGVGAVNTHKSDNTLTELDFDLVVHNDGSLEDLHTQAKSLIYDLDWLEK